MKIGQKIQAINQADFANIIRVDYHYDNNIPIGNGHRMALFECPKCGNEYEGRVAVEKQRKDIGCTRCHLRHKYPGYYRKQRLLQEFAKVISPVGVWFDRKFKHYTARINVNGKRIHLGNSENREEAMLKYDDYLEEHGLDRTRNFDLIPRNFE